jgi:hypothetical protein
MTRIPYIKSIACLLALVVPALQSAYAAEELSGEGQVTEETREAMESMDIMADLGFAQKDEALELIFAALTSVDRQIVSLDEKVENLAVQAGERRQKLMDQLFEHRDEVSARYEEIKGSSAEAWQQVKGEFLSAFDSLYQDLARVHRYVAERS